MFYFAKLACAGRWRMSDVTRQTDLTKLEGDPTDRSAFTPHIETVEAAIEVIGGNKVNLATKSAEGSAQNAAMTSDARRFHPASDTPNSDHCTLSHMTACVPSS